MPQPGTLKKRREKAHYVVFLLCLAASFFIVLLLSKNILPAPFWFLSVFLIAFGTMIYSRRNYLDAKNATDKRRHQRALRKKQQHDRYL